MRMRVEVISVMVLLVLGKEVIVKLIWLFNMDFVKDWNIVVFFCVNFVIFFKFKCCFWLVVIKWENEWLKILKFGILRLRYCWNVVLLKIVEWDLGLKNFWMSVRLIGWRIVIDCELLLYEFILGGKNRVFDVIE